MRKCPPGSEQERDDRPPPWGRLVKEAPALARLVVNQFRAPVLREPLGGGRPVLVLPGFLTNDASTRLLRRSLAACGFRPFGWSLGFNLGARADLIDRLSRRLEEVVAKEGKPAILLGWSLGGLYARELASRRPSDVRAVVTLGSPFSGSRRANNAWKLYELINDHPVDQPPIEMDSALRPPVPTVAVWSGVDGIVAPAGARGSADEAHDRVQIDVPHMALGSDPGAIRKIIRLLARFALPEPVAASG